MGITGGEAVATTLKELVMVTQRMLEMVKMRIAAPPARAAIPRLEMQPFKPFSGLAKDYLGWCHNWEHQIPVQYDNAAQISYVKNYLPTNLVQEVVGAHVTTIAKVWAELDRRFGNPMIVASGIRKELEGLDLKTLGRTSSQGSMPFY